MPFARPLLSALAFWRRDIRLGFDTRTPRPTRRVAFTLESLAFGEGVRRSSRWIPEALTPLSYLPVYGVLEAQERLHYNQLTALALAEKYIFLEDHVLTPAIHSLLRCPRVEIDAGARAEMELFCAEETKHSEAFWRLLESAAPELYPQRRFRYMKTGVAARAFLASCEAVPSRSTAWIWLALFFEELTIRISRQYANDREADSLFRDVHHAHMTEEAAHVPLDRMLLARVFDTQTILERKAAFAVFEAFLSQFSTPRRTPFLIVNEVATTHPRLRPLLPRVRQELSTLKGNAAFQEEFYSPRAAPLTFKLLARYAEAQPFLQRLSVCGEGAT